MKHISLTMIIAATMTMPFAMASDITDKESDRILHKNQALVHKYAVDQGKPAPQVIKYKYGMEMDIVKVVSVSRPAEVCRVVPARITYEDSQGSLNTIEYLVMGTGCRSDG